MTEIQRIIDQLNRAFLGNAWHGPAVMEILDGITPQRASERPLNATHSIWEIALHIGACTSAGRRRLAGDRAQLSDAEDWPEVPDANEKAWEETREALIQAHQQLVEAISRVDEERLDQPIMEGMGSVYVTLHGIIQHTLYHAGQMALLKKAALEQKQ